jgi:predicted neuraminidase
MLFLYNKDLMNNSVPEDILSSDEKINNILYTYKRSKLQYLALEFGLIYNFNSINLNKKQ